MKTRTITGIIMAIFVFPFILLGTHFMMAFVTLLLGLGVYEFLNVKSKAKLDKIPIYVYVISFVFAFLLIFDLPIYADNSLVFDYYEGLLNSYSINPIWVVSYLFVLFACSVFDKKFSIVDAMYSFSTILYLSLGLKGMLYLRSHDLFSSGIILIGYVLLVTCLTDIFAYFGGMTCYKLLGDNKVHKLNVRISPKKTIEGTIIGTVLATISGFFFSIYLIFNGDYSYWIICLLLSFLLSICGQIGDLILSAIKRFFNIKDYSSLLPGHGGVLDRLDSILINCMVAALFISLII